MKLLKVIEAKYLEDYKIALQFNNGKSGVVDLEQKVFNDHRKVFEKLKNQKYFKTFEQNRWTIEWSNGIDLAPEFLYDLLKEQKPLKQTIN